MRYGMPYMGSKNQIAKWVIENLPKKENLYDLFGGGGAITHCACESGKFKYVIYNEYNQLVAKAFDMAIHGKFRNENRWISREEFNALKDKDPYVAICFSFGNNLTDYCYSKEKEPYKKAFHNAVCFNDFSDAEKLNLDLSFIKGNNIEEKRRSLDNNLPLYHPELKDFFKYQKRNCDNKNLTHLENKNRLERLQSLERLERLQSLDYRRVRIKNNSVIYCDPPYINTHKYIFDFDYDAFYSWCEQQKQITVISSYEMPEDRFICVAKKEKRSLMCKDDNTTKKTEKLFVPKHQYQMYLDAMAVLN